MVGLKRSLFDVKRFWKVRYFKIEVVSLPNSILWKNEYGKYQ